MEPRAAPICIAGLIGVSGNQTIAPRTWKSLGPSVGSNYNQKYGGICFGVIAGVTGEVLSISFEEIPPVPSECCEYLPECSNCKYLLEDIGDPIGPELTIEGRTYWFDFPSGWSIKLIVTGNIDPSDHSFERGASVNVEIGVRPPKAEYADWSLFRTDSLRHGDWLERLHRITGTSSRLTAGL